MKKPTLNIFLGDKLVAKDVKDCEISFTEKTPEFLKEQTIFEKITNQLLGKHDVNIYNYLKDAIIGLGVCNEEQKEQIDYILGKYVEYSSINNTTNYWLNIEGERTGLVKVKNTFSMINKGLSVEVVCDTNITELWK